MFGPDVRGYPAEVSDGGKRALMQVDPTRLVELAASSEGILAEMAHDWRAAAADLAHACAGLGDATGTSNVASSYADSLADAGEVVSALAQALGVGITGLVDAAQDAARADDTVAGELTRAATRIEHDGFETLPGRGGR